MAQPAANAGLGEVLVTANRQNAPFAQQDRPVVGLRRAADSVVMPLVISSDTREALTRNQEIHTVLLAAMERARAAGFELVSGGFRVEPVTAANYKSLPIEWAGRVDTGKVQLLVKAKLEGSAAATQARLQSFVGSLKGSGRANAETSGAITLTVINPDQYRDAIVGLVAADAKYNAAIFGPEFTFNVTGIDGQVAWSQVSSTDVFLYIPYRYTIYPSR
ncbi:MAG: hypothetical protein ACREBO_05245 [Novosphingobium sp.]